MTEPLSEAYLSIYISHTRNTFTLTSLGIATISFGKYFEEKDPGTPIPIVIRAAGSGLFVLSVVHGILAGLDFDAYLRAETRETGTTATRIRKEQLLRWRKWIILNYIFLGIVTLVAAVVSVLKIRNHARF